MMTSFAPRRSERRSYRILILVVLCLSPMAAGAESNADYASKSARFASLRTFCDLLIERCRDDYGPKKLRLWPNAYDLDQRSVPLPNPKKPWPGQFGGHAPYGSNLQQQA